MKKILLTACIIIVPLLQLYAAEPSARTTDNILTLEIAKKIAIKNNPGVGQTLARIRSSRALLGQAYASWFPTISLSGGYFNRHVDIQPDWQPDIRVKKNIREATGNLELNWLLFNGFARKAETLAAKYGVEQAKQIHADTQRLLVESIATAYYQAQLARENICIADNNAEFNRALEKNATIRRRVGATSRSEMLNFSIRAVQAESDSIQAERNYTIACAILAELMGIPDTELPSDLAPISGNRIIANAVPAYENLISTALNNRPDLKAIDAGINAAEERKNAAKGSWMPGIGLTAGLNYTKQTGADPVQEERNRYAGITASWDVFTGGRRSAGFQQKKAEVYALEEEKRRVILSIQSGIRQAIANAEAAEQQWERQEKARKMTLQVRNDVELLYKTGSADLTRLNEAQTDLVRAEGLSASSKVHYLLALEKLLSESGGIQPKAE